MHQLIKLFECEQKSFNWISGSEFVLILLFFFAHSELLIKCDFVE